MREYLEYEGRQNCCIKIIAIFLHRLRIFSRCIASWIVLVVPVTFVVAVEFYLYCFMKAAVP